MINQSGRQSGRTSAMLHRAISEALSGQNVMVVASNHKNAVLMMQRAIDMERPSKVVKSQMRLEYFKGCVVFVVDTPRREAEQGWRDPVLVDHYVHEKMTCGI